MGKQKITDEGFDMTGAVLYTEKHRSNDFRDGQEGCLYG